MAAEKSDPLLGPALVGDDDVNALLASGVKPPLVGRSGNDGAGANPGAAPPPNFGICGSCNLLLAKSFARLELKVLAPDAMSAGLPVNAPAPICAAPSIGPTYFATDDGRILLMRSGIQPP